MNKQLKETILQGLLMAAAVAVALPVPEFAFAGTDLAASATTVQTGLQNIPNIISTAFYIGGAAMVGAGALKLKAHSENPQTKLGEGLGRVGAGAALIALPGFAGWLQASLGVNGTAVGYTKLAPASP
jgi:hypothetical protein